MAVAKFGGQRLIVDGHISHPRKLCNGSAKPSNRIVVIAEENQ